MSPSLPLPASSAALEAPLPPLPKMQTAAPADPMAGQGMGGDNSGMAAILSGIVPVKSAVDQIAAACAQISQAAIIPGADQVLQQIMALATSLVPMAAQNLLAPAGASAGAGMAGMAGMGMGQPPMGGPIPPVGMGI